MPAGQKEAKFKFFPFTKKQKQVLTWWTETSPKKDYDCIIADGAVRSGKTLLLSLAYVFWAMETFSGKKFGMAGKTIGSFRRNVLFSLKIVLNLRGFKVHDNRSDNLITVRKNGVENYFHIFGGKDEKSQDLVQGFTSAGFLFDEVVLMPESFVNQAIARCSEEGAKLWFNCNPDGPFHWFKVNWLDCLEEKNALQIHFELDDNPSLSEKVKERYRRMFRGIFHERFILGRWVLAEGVIYSMFNSSMIIRRLPKNVKITKKWIGVDYGHSNATVFLLIGLGSDSRLYILDEYYHEGLETMEQKSPSKYSKEYFAWKIKNGVSGQPVNREYSFIDPSAKGFMLQLHEDGERRVRQAVNDVLKGIELITSLIDNDMLRVFNHCENTIKEFGAYRWDEKAGERGEDKPIKQHDHCMDALRYMVNGTRQIWQKLIVFKSNKKAA